MLFLASALTANREIYAKKAMQKLPVLTIVAQESSKMMMTTVGRGPANMIPLAVVPMMIDAMPEILLRVDMTKDAAVVEEAAVVNVIILLVGKHPRANHLLDPDAMTEMTSTCVTEMTGRIENATARENDQSVVNLLFEVDTEVVHMIPTIEAAVVEAEDVVILKAKAIRS